MTTTVQCPECGKAARVPEDRGRLRINCKGCGRQYEWAPGDYAAAAPPPPRQSERIDIVFSCSRDGRAFSLAFERGTPAEKFRLMKGVVTFPQGGGGDGPRHGGGAAIIDDQIDFGGWTCPHCGYDGGSGRSLFVKCGSCGNLICGHTLKVRQDGSATFRCTPSCGNVGEISGTISSYDAIANRNKKRF